jgi:hypothetical protein
MPMHVYNTPLGSSATSTFGALGRGAFALRVRVSATPSYHPRDDVVASQPEARGAAVQQQFHLLRTSTFDTPDDFMLRRVLNRDEVNKLDT